MVYMLASMAIRKAIEYVFKQSQEVVIHGLFLYAAYASIPLVRRVISIAHYISPL